MDKAKIMGIVGMVAGSIVGGAVSFGVYGAAKDRGWASWKAGAASGGASAVLATALILILNKVAGETATAGLPRAHNLSQLATGLTSASIGALGPGIPSLGPVRLGAYTSQRIGAYTADRVGANTVKTRYDQILGHRGARPGQFPGNNFGGCAGCN